MLRCYAYETDKLQMMPCPEAPGEDPRVYWFDMISPTPEEDEQVERYLGISVPTRDEMAEIELSDRLYFENGALYMTMTALSSLETDDAAKTPVTFVIKDDTLVTVRHADPRPFRAYVVRSHRPGAVSANGGELVMLGLIEAVIDRTADALERIGDAIDALSHEIFVRKGDKPRDLQLVTEKIGHKGDLITKIQESLVSLSRMMAFYAASEIPMRRNVKEVKQRVKLIQRDASSLSEHTNFLNGKINFLLEATLGLINLEQNKIIKIFSVASVVMLPPTLVASAYGMNFQFMPELDWNLGYPFALGLMVISAVLPYLYFKRKGWL